MPTRTRELAENALMLGLALILLFISTYTIIGLVTVLFVPIPFVLLGLRRSIRNMIVVVLIFTFLGMIMTGLVGSILAFSSALLGAVLGIMYQKSRLAMPAIIAGAAVVFLSYVITLAFASFGLHINLEESLEKLMVVAPPFLSAEEWKELKSVVKMVLPTFFVVSSFMMSGLTHWLSRLIGNRIGHPIPALKPLREWGFPRSLLYYYFIALLLLLFFGKTMESSFWESAILNIKVMLDVIFTVQGLSFCLFMFHLKGWKILTPVLIVSLFIFPLLTNILSLVGIFDLGVDLRKKLETRVKRG